MHSSFFQLDYVCDIMDVDVERLDDEKNRTVNKLIDLCLSLTEEVMRLKDLIESSTRNRRMAAAKPPAPSYSCVTTPLIDSFIRDVRQQQQQQQQEEEEQRVDEDLGMVNDDVFSSDSSWCEDMIDCDDSRRVENRPPPLKRMKFT